MTDHPMQCYPGQFEPWKRGYRVWLPDTLEVADALQGRNLHGREPYEDLANWAIGRAMSGQIISSTGGRT